MSPLNINSWHGLTKLNIMIFVFFTFMVSAHSAQNYWNALNSYCSLTSCSDIIAWSSSKINNHMCTSVRASASHSLSSKCPSRASKYSPNSRGLKRQPCFTLYWHLKLEVTPLLGWLMCAVSLAYVATPLWGKCEVATHTPENGNGSPLGLPKI
jgi:hypothetical protein